MSREENVKFSSTHPSAGKRRLGVLYIESPCSVKLEELEGRPEGWFCNHCQKSVHDLSKLTALEAKLLYLANRGALCGRQVFDANGDPIYEKFCDTKAIRKRFAKPFFQSTLVLALSACSFPRGNGEGAGKLGVANCRQESAPRQAKFSSSESSDSTSRSSISFWEIENAEAQGGGPSAGGMAYYDDELPFSRLLSFILGPGTYAALVASVALGALLCVRFARRLRRSLASRFSRGSK